MRALFLLLLTAASLWARVLFVPSATLPTIQSGLDSLQDGDTVSIALGTYAEALHAPARTFTLQGRVVSDTGDYPRPIIDPAPLEGSDSLRVLTLPQGSLPVIEDLHFRNGPEMYPRFNWRAGGIELRSAACIWRRCVFDSLYGGITAAATCSLRLEQCHFHKVYNSVYSGDDTVFVHAEDCDFTGSGWAHVMATGGASIERCLFGANNLVNEEGEWLCAVTGNVKISNCQFGPYLPGETTYYPVVQVYAARGVIEHNLFTGLVMSHSLITVGSVCGDTNAVVVRNNNFVHNRIVPGAHQGNMAIFCQCPTDTICRCGIIVDSNRFEDNANNRGVSHGLALFRYETGHVSNNYLQNLTVDSTVHWPVGHDATVYIDSFAELNMSNNRFDHTDIALWDQQSERPTRHAATRNWWGSSSGPYHEQFNPEGRGDTIIGNSIDFSGWCVDTCCTVYASAKSVVLQPKSYTLSAYPNPFNAVTTIRLTVPDPQICRVELFDMLGRRVKEVWAGVVADEQEMALDGQSLASGIYFLRATNTIWNRPLASSKLVLLK